MANELDSKSFVLSVYPDAHHGLGQHAYVSGFQDCSDYVYSGIPGGEYLSLDQNGERAAWAEAAEYVRRNQGAEPNGE